MLRIISLVLLLTLAKGVFAQQDIESVYVDIRPDFVTNYDEGARLKYLKASVSLKVPGENEMQVRHHLPSVQNGLIILFSSQAEENLTSTVGRETLRREALDEVRRIIAGLIRDGDELIEDLYFTNFVVQQ